MINQIPLIMNDLTLIPYNHISYIDAVSITQLTEQLLSNWYDSDNYHLIKIYPNMAQTPHNTTTRRIKLVQVTMRAYLSSSRWSSCCTVYL